MSGNKNKIIAFNYFGGKFSWLDDLYSCFPNDFTHLVELFAGSMAVSLNYDGKVIKTAVELNAEITNFFQVLRDREDDLIRLLLLTPCSEQEYNNCWEKSDDSIESARRFYVRVRQSFFGLGAQRKNKGWHMAKSQVNCQGGETVSRWNNAIRKLHDVAEVIRRQMQIINRSYEEAIQKLDTETTLFYADPPYPEETRKSKNDYKFEFTTDQHIDLCDRLHKIDGLAMVSSYESDLYNDLYRDWYKIKFPKKKNNIRSSEVQEIVWCNYDPPKRKYINAKQQKLEL